MKLMDADAFVDLIMGEPPEPHYPDWYAAAARKMPEIQAEPVVHGKWVRKYSRPGVYADLLWYCSACGVGFRDSWANLFKRCPECGAVMEPGKDGETDG